VIRVEDKSFGALTKLNNLMSQTTAHCPVYTYTTLFTVPALIFSSYIPNDRSDTIQEDMPYTEKYDSG